MIRAAGIAVAEVPVEPDADEAREWLQRELQGPEYAAAQPTWFDLAWQDFLEWLDSLALPSGGAASPLGALVIVLIVAALVGLAFLVFGLPRRERRRRATGALFGERDDRDAAALRRSAAAALSAGDWATAIAERFRAIARDLDERTILSLSPGTTAHDAAGRAGLAFPEHATGLAEAARAFDAVRYLGGAGSREEAEQVARLDDAVRAARPRLETAGA
jgi:hypothetical protein